MSVACYSNYIFVSISKFRVSTSHQNSTRQLRWLFFSIIHSLLSCEVASASAPFPAGSVSVGHCRFVSRVQEEGKGPQTSDQESSEVRFVAVPLLIICFCSEKVPTIHRTSTNQFRSNVWFDDQVFFQCGQFRQLGNSRASGVNTHRIPMGVCLFLCSSCLYCLFVCLNLQLV